MVGPFLPEYQTRLDQLLKEQAGDLTTADKNAAIENAVKEHSKYRAQEIVGDIAGNDTYDYEMELLADWEEGFSVIKKLEYPAGERVPVYLEDEDWTIYKDTVGQKLRFLNDSPTSLETIRVTYSARHDVTETAGTIPEADSEAVCHLAAKYALLALMNRYLQNTEPTLGADSVDHKSKAMESRSNANKEETEYFQHMGIKPGEVTAGMAFKDHDVNYPWGEDRLTHGRRWR